MDINGDCLLCESQLEDINHMFIHCPLVKEVRSTIAGGHVPIMINHFIDLINYIYKK